MGIPRFSRRLPVTKISICGQTYLQTALQKPRNANVPTSRLPHFTQNYYCSQVTQTDQTPPISRRQLLLTALSSAIPMVGFGFMDNIVMIQAGEAIDLTLGVTFGLSTLTAAALGQVISDFSGVCFGGTVDAMVTKMGLPTAELTSSQRLLKSVRLSMTGGAALGVVVGCSLGMTSLLFMDLDKADRMKREQELNTIFETIMEHGHKSLNSEKCSLFLVDTVKNVLWSKVFDDIVVSSEEKSTIHLPIDQGIVGHVMKTGEPAIVVDAYSDTRFSDKADQLTGFRTRNIICAPVFDENQKKIIAIIQAVNKRNGPFTQDDMRMLQMMCDHVSIFMKHCEKV